MLPHGLVLHEVPSPWKVPPPDSQSPRVFMLHVVPLQQAPRTITGGSSSGSSLLNLTSGKLCQSVSIFTGGFGGRI
jgi:hypothetical protein